VQEFNLFLEDNIFKLHYQLINKTYQHSHYTSFYVKDPKLRHIHKACVKDRVLHHAIFRILYYIFDNTFIHDSYSCRLNKGTHRAVNRLNYFAKKLSKNNTKTCYILKLDIKKFFDSVDQVKYYIRYCDDFIIINDKKEYLEKLILVVDNFLKKTLKLSLHPDKIIIRKYYQGIDFLGYVFFP